MVVFPSETPAEDMVLLQHVKGDTFRRVRSDDTLGEEVVFEKDPAGKVTHYRKHSNRFPKVK
jgi:hypothetical protein